MSTLYLTQHTEINANRPGRHCDGPASTTATATSSSSGASTTTATPTVPSPSESVGCEPHGDHWHCDGPAETGAAGMIGVDLAPVVGLAAGVAALYV